MEIYDFGIDFGAYVNTLAILLATPIATVIGYELGLMIIGQVLRFLRNI